MKNRKTNKKTFIGHRLETDRLDQGGLAPSAPKRKKSRVSPLAVSVQVVPHPLGAHILHGLGPERKYMIAGFL